MCKCALNFVYVSNDGVHVGQSPIGNDIVQISRSVTTKDCFKDCS